VTALVAAGCCLVAVLVWLRLRLVRVLVNGASMEPTLRAGVRVLVRRVPARRVKPGEIVVFARPRAPERGWMIKRVRAVPGDVVPRRDVPLLWRYPGAHVPPGSLVVLGDNASESYDSRTFGYVRASSVLGVVVVRSGWWRTGPG
jgi:signal peptidase I